MKVLFDTSVLLPALDVKHTQHEACYKLLKNCEANAEVIVLNTHLMAELFNNLTKQPRLAITVAEINLTVHRLADRYVNVELNMTDYLAAIDRCTSLGLRGGVVYDALHFQAAIKAKVNVLYTGNLRDFERLKTEEITFGIKSPY
ncbi:type II toxin-antitoxin system VapC family toxin [Neolewinella antarctica]|uniref:Nucleic acid-binding protein n=1 Tax=Neolewinella antarctica TaxID=442734 RepID=A0ABX0XGR4_9BACT|nr:PIN domain-containing protein [Neolewinella antarctica]NJC28387.1 putative nucleic acid-binding protein [Neolewinella antarctica]